MIKLFMKNLLIMLWIQTCFVTSLQSTPIIIYNNSNWVLELTVYLNKQSILFSMKGEHEIAPIKSTKLILDPQDTMVFDDDPQVIGVEKISLKPYGEGWGWLNLGEVDVFDVSKINKETITKTKKIKITIGTTLGKRGYTWDYPMEYIDKGLTDGLASSIPEQLRRVYNNYQLSGKTMDLENAIKKIAREEHKDVQSFCRHLSRTPKNLNKSEYEVTKRLLKQLLNLYKGIKEGGLSNNTNELNQLDEQFKIYKDIINFCEYSDVFL